MAINTFVRYAVITGKKFSFCVTVFQNFALQSYSYLYYDLIVFLVI